MPSAEPPPPAPAHLSTLQIGMGWFPENAGGLNRMYHGLAQHLPDTGVDVQGLVTGSAMVWHESCGHVRAFAAAGAPLPVRWRNARHGARRLLAARDTDLVVSHFALYTVALLDLLDGRPLIVHFHGPWALEGRFERDSRARTLLKSLVERLVYRRASRFIVLSRAFGAILQREYSIHADLIHVIPGGVDVDRFALDLPRATARTRLGLPAERPLLLSVRRLRRRMGLENLLIAMQTVRRQVPDALLLIAGQGELAPLLAEQVRARGLERHVRLLGLVAEDDLPLLYRAADLVVMPTVALEGMGLVTLEALAAGTPVLVTPVGGLPEAVQQLSPDLVLPDTRPQTLATGIVDVLRDRGSLPSDAACRTYARARFDWPVIAAQVRQVYAAVAP